MADRSVDFLVIGGGAAGWSCARALRDASADGSIMVVSREPDPPYDRTVCSKGYLQGRSTRAEALLSAPEWWDEHAIELKSRTSAMKLDAGAREATLSSRETVGFGRALIATGALVRRLRVDGSNLDGIHYLRSLGNSDQIRRDADSAENIVLVGGSYIASEVAASLASLGKRCTMVMRESVTLERAFGERAGRYFQRVLEQGGVAVIGGDEVERFEGDERVARAITRQGREIDADLVVIGAGVMPDVQLARAAGLEIGTSGGVAVDAEHQTSAGGIFAAGDVCDFDSALLGRRARIEHWEVAVAQGRRAAASMLDAELPDEEVPYFFCDLADWASLEYIGPASRWDREVVHGSLEDGEFSFWYLDGGRVAAVLSVGRPQDLEVGRRLLRSRASVDEARLAAELA